MNTQKDQIVLNLVIKIWQHLSTLRKIQFFLILGLTILASISEVISIGLVLPFLAVLMNPEKLLDYPAIKLVLGLIGIHKHEDFQLFLTLLFAFAMTVASILKIALVRAQIYFTYLTSSDLSVEMYTKTLSQPYAIHTSRNSSDIISTLVSKSTLMSTNGLSPAISFCSSALIILSILIMLAVLEPFVITAPFLVFGLIYIAIARFLRWRLKIDSQLINFGYPRVVKIVQEGLGGIRDILLEGSQKFYISIYSDAEVTLKKAMASSNFLSTAPRYLIELLGTIAIVLIAFLLTSNDGNFSGAIPLLGVLAMSAQRLLPLLQQCFSAWASLSSADDSIKSGLKLLDQPISPKLDFDNDPINFNEKIELKNLSFRYSGDEPDVLSNVNLEVQKGSFVGLIGSTGSGKSTLFDCLMGLLEPTSGGVIVDGCTINKMNVAAWQRRIAHVPQSIFLADVSIAENIALGISKVEIDYERVREAARKAQISNFIESLELGFETLVGDRGVRLSGGQRQRIGIARAFYKSADVIIFDEATSALDSQTEAEVMGSIHKNYQNCTIFAIAHRISTLKECDLIVELSQGRVSRVITYKELLNGN